MNTTTAPNRSKLKPGVVTGEDYRTLLAACRDGGYALPAVNVIGTSTINAVLESAARNKSDVIIQLSSGGAQFYAGQGMKDSAQARVLGAVSAADGLGAFSTAADPAGSAGDEGSSPAGDGPSATGSSRAGV